MYRNKTLKKPSDRNHLKKKSALAMILLAIIASVKKYMCCKKTHLFIISICMFSVFSCDEHQDFPDMSMKIGEVLLSDGRVVSLSEAKSGSYKPVGVVFYTNNSGQALGSGYAVALEDLPFLCAMADTLGVSQGTSASVSDYDGNSNTYALFTNSNAVCPAANELFAIWTYGQSAFIPSVAEIRLLYTAKSTINPIIEELGGTPLPSDADEAWYWTSTEVENQEGNKIWLFSMASGAIHETPKNELHKVRPIITLWYE